MTSRRELEVPSSPDGLGSLSPGFSSGPEDAFAAIEMRQKRTFFPDHIDLSDSMVATPSASLESNLLKLCNKKFLNNVCTFRERDEENTAYCTGTLIEDRAKKYYKNLAWPRVDVTTATGKTISVFSEGDVPIDDPDFDDSTSDYGSVDGTSLHMSPWLRSISRSISHHYDQRRRRSNQFTNLDYYSPAGLYRTDGRYYGQQGGLRTSKTRAPLTNVFSIPRLSGGDLSDQEEDLEVKKQVTTEPMTEDNIKGAVVKIRNDLIKLREDDRKLLKQFIQIRFGIEYLCQSRSRSGNNRSCRDLSMLGTFPRSPPPNGKDDTSSVVFRQRALSLRSTNIRGMGTGSSFAHGAYSAIKES